MCKIARFFAVQKSTDGKMEVFERRDQIRIGTYDLKMPYGED